MTIQEMIAVMPEPEPPKLRPWKPEEVPVGATLRGLGSGYKTMLLGVPVIGNNAWIAGDRGTLTISPEDLLENYEHSLDGGKTWLPCGVEE